MAISTRRKFIKNSLLSAGFISFMNIPQRVWSFTELQEKLSIHIFSKHLQFLDYRATGEMAAEMGFSGIDLTVRPGGHVLPELVKTDLPKAIAEIRSGGSDCKMITTRIENINNPLDVDILNTAAKLDVKYYRTNWFKYAEGQSMNETLEIYQKQVQELGKLNSELGLVGCYQNHAGTNVGASFWEVKKILESVDPDYFGVQYDIRHAMVEGGLSWENGLRLLQAHIKNIVLKDFKWGKENGQWKPINTPIGEGMVDFDKYFKLLKKYRIKPSVSLHLEYDLGGAEKGNTTISVDKKVVFDAMKKDLNAIQKLWEKA